MSGLVEVDDLTFKYVGRKRPALRGVSFRVEPGESLLVLGPSGCGKSTLALCLNGAIPQFIEGDLRGQVRVDGVDTRAASMAHLAQQVGIVFQDPESQFCMLTVEEEVAFGLENLAAPRADMDARIAEALGWVGLGDCRAVQIERLSGGQKQRLALACVLAQRPAVLVFDEPTAQLDPAGAAEVIDLLRRLRSDGRHSLVIVEHRLDDVLPLIDRTLVLGHDGEVVAHGPMRQVMQHWSASLAAAGVWVPQVSELATALAERHIRLEPFPLTVDDAAQALQQFSIGPHPVLEASPVPEPLFDVRRLSYHYPSSGRQVLRDVSLTLSPRQVTAIAGGNGAGKSTLARLLARILSPPPNCIWLCGDDLSRLGPAEVARRVGYVFQYPEHQFIGATVLDDVLFGLRRAGVPEPDARARALDMLTDFGLMPLVEAHPFTLSHGEQRRLSVAAMLVLDQSALLLDEPTSGQDRRNHSLLLDRLSALAGAGRAIVAITHDMRLVAERASRVLAMADGEVIFDGAPRELFANRQVLDRARLRPPPVWELGQRLGLAEPFLSVADALARLAAP